MTLTYQDKVVVAIGSKTHFGKGPSRPAIMSCIVEKYGDDQEKAKIPVRHALTALVEKELVSRPTSARFLLTEEGKEMRAKLTTAPKKTVKKVTKAAPKRANKPAPKKMAPKPVKTRSGRVSKPTTAFE